MTTQDQEKALTLMRSGKNVCLLGDAGTGKSWVLRKFLEENQGKNIVRCAPTGIAAINIGGVTLHRAFKIPVKPFPLGSWDNKSFPNPTIKAADIIVIDEISMCRLDVMDYIGATLKDLKAQLIVVGDFGQLPPVIKENDDEYVRKRGVSNDKESEDDRKVLEQFYTEITDGFPFEARCWDDFHFEYINLKEVVRQTDRNFVIALNKVKNGDPTGLAYINRNHATDVIEGAVTLVGYNRTAQKMNEDALKQIIHFPKTYYLSRTGQVSDDDLVAEKFLTLKVGARVISIMNDKSRSQKYQNGTFGTVIRLEDSKVVVQFDNNQTADIYYAKWEVKNYHVANKNGKKQIEEKIIGSYSQIPLKLGYAITIHKSQGQTYDGLNLIPQIFVPGQLYVALSRAKSLNRLCIYGWLSKKEMMVSESYLKFMRDHNLLNDSSTVKVSEYSFADDSQATQSRNNWKETVSKSSPQDFRKVNESFRRIDTQEPNRSSTDDKTGQIKKPIEDSISKHASENVQETRKKKTQSKRLKKTELKNKQIIIHKSFGLGQIIGINNTHMTIHFYENPYGEDMRFNIESCLRNERIIVVSPAIDNFKTKEKKSSKTISQRERNNRASRAQAKQKPTVVSPLSRNSRESSASPKFNDAKNDKVKNITMGSKVNHKDFGNGLVTAIDNEHITVNFGEVTKQFVTKICIQKKLIRLIE